MPKAVLKQKRDNNNNMRMSQCGTLPPELFVSVGSSWSRRAITWRASSTGTLLNRLTTSKLIMCSPASRGSDIYVPQNRLSFAHGRLSFQTVVQRCLPVFWLEDELEIRWQLQMGEGNSLFVHFWQAIDLLRC